MKRILPDWMTKGNQNNRNATVNCDQQQQISSRVKPIFDVSTETTAEEPSTSTNGNAEDQEQNPELNTTDRDCVICENPPSLIDLSDEENAETNSNQPTTSGVSADPSSTSPANPIAVVQILKQEPKDDSSPSSNSNINNDNDPVSTTKIKTEVKSEPADSCTSAPADSSTPALKPSCQFGIKCYM